MKKNTGLNVVSANECNGNRRGTSVGGRASDMTANQNLFFNNVCRGNRLNGVSSGNSCARDNYFSQIVVGQSQDLDLVPQGGGNARFLASPAAGLVEIPSIRESGIADVGVKSDQPERGFIPKFGWLLALVLMVVAFGAGSKWKRS